MKISFAIGCILSLMLAVTPSHASDNAALLATSQAAYDRGMELQRHDPNSAALQFESSAKGFQELLDHGVVNGSLLYNLGNSQLQQGLTGAAIGSYLQAQRLIPGDSRLQANLAHARSLVRDRFDRGSGLLLEDVAGWWHLLSQNTRLALAAVLWIAGWVVVCGRLFVRGPIPFWPFARLRSFAPHAAWICVMAGAVLMTTVVVDVISPVWQPVGVTVADGVVVRKGNGDGFEPAFAEPLSQGVEFQVVEERPGWLQIRLPDGKSGWIKSLQAHTA